MRGFRIVYTYIYTTQNKKSRKNKFELKVRTQKTQKVGCGVSPLLEFTWSARTCTRILEMNQYRVHGKPFVLRAVKTSKNPTDGGPYPFHSPAKKKRHWLLLFIAEVAYVEIFLTGVLL